MIDSYDFGRIVVNGKVYTADIIISPEGVKDNWWRKEGHKLHIEDIDDALKTKPEVLVVGTGYNGLMKVTKEVRAYVESRGIQLLVDDTKRACEVYNQLHRSRRAVAALHLTC